MKGAVPGAFGEVDLSFWPESGFKRLSAEWIPVDPGKDFTHQFKLINLQPGTKYQFTIHARKNSADKAVQEIAGRFKTAPAKTEASKITFTVVTGQDFHRRDDEKNGHKIYEKMLKLDPKFFVHTGDIIYYDKPKPVANTIELALHHWHRIYSLPFQREFHNNVTSYFIKDDHDTWCNDCWPTMKKNYGDFSFEDGLKIFPEQVPMGEKTYRTFRWGKDLQIWLVEGRDFRSANTDKDGSQKTIWGDEQKAWFKRTVKASDATFKILISPTPLVGPDRKNKNDNHANAGFQFEGRELRKFIAGQKNMNVICGDRHWQYVTVDPVTGLKEFCSGPTSNQHAGGFSNKNKSAMHKYLNVVGGFLSGTVERRENVPRLILRHHAVDGKVLHEERIE